MRREPSRQGSTPQSVIAGRYHLVGRISKGLTSEVWWAWDRDARAERVVKLLPPGADKVRRFRFLEEIGRMRSIAHPGVVRVFDSGERDGRAFAVLENVIGGSLASRAKREAPPSPAEVVRIGVQLLAALDAVHRAGLVHGAVSLDHVLLDGKNHVRLVDFGAAQSGVSPDVDVEATALLLLTLLTGRPPRLPADLEHPGVPEVLRPALSAMLGDEVTTPSALAAARMLSDAIPPASTPVPADERDAVRRPTGLAITGVVGIGALLGWAFWMAT
jgi:serine/threonine protein kinase